MTIRRGDWMQTYSGRQFWPLDPLPSDIFIEDIAHALSKLCRYGGHCEGFYSVAQHSVLVSLHVPPNLALEGLLHDASEAYLGEMIRPIKPFMSKYKLVEHEVEMTIAERFDLYHPWPDEVKRIDLALLHDEHLALMKEPPLPWYLPEPPLGIQNLTCLDPKEACNIFLERFHILERNK